ncbi:MAG: RdgB/HAM1 family non-canonical purine NTP pyrophosphatase [Gammaproteobacteria bacterium]|jgi:XTP/dITP diphosphohydrolase|nr:RdgB/HAM1 family non-canonical purine NTP pyrophosphatase [Gammaproteobacteria bacterium]
MKIVLASSNKGKVKEIQEMMKNLDVSIVPQSEFHVSVVEETGLSFVENALIKARHASQSTHLPAIADDSGLVVDALQGAPGIYSARFAKIDATDKENIDKLLEEMKFLSKEQRQAHFYCALAFVLHERDPVPLICQAKWDGVILEAPIGENGFGYDPIFYIPSLHCTSAQLSPDIKNTLSHRAKALQLFVEQFKLLSRQ